jgi:hypothetical protein
MSVIRKRAIDNFPMVLLTLLSIVQALAFELLWAEVHQHRELYQWSMIAVIGWIQIAAMFLGIVLVWTSYATNVMRFRWVPSTVDSLFPFLVGILQFIMIDNLGIERISLWFLLLALLFAGMNFIAHHLMKRARLNTENEEFFVNRRPATLRDFYATIVVVGAMCMGSLVVWLNDRSVVLYGCAVALALAVIVRQVFVANYFWQVSMSLDSVINQDQQESGYGPDRPEDGQ